MKFLWLPWYTEIINTSRSYLDVRLRVQKAIDEGKWKIISDNIYSGYVYNNRFEIFFRRWLALTREMGSNKVIILFGEVEKLDNGSRVKISITLNWFAYLFFVPLSIAPLIMFFIDPDWRFLVLFIVLYIVLISAWNFHALNLYRFLKNILDQD